MAAGDIVNPSRVRWSSNQRVDAVDAEALSSELREHADALTRSLLATPLNAGSSEPVGMIMTGFGLTLNPTGGSDGKVRIGTPLGVALDADGRYVIKPVSDTIDITIPAGTHQVYVYSTEVQTENAARRFITASSPFSDIPKNTDTKYKDAVGTFVRSGNTSNVVASANVNGRTRALCLIAVATNTAGVISIAGHNAVTAPNGSFITNRAATAKLPSTPPTLSTISGSPRTVHELLSAAMHYLGQAAWKGSDFLTPSASNNYGAYNIPAGGVDKAFREVYGDITIGDGVTTFGDYNTADYANANALLVAAIAALPAAGGRIYLKRGVALSNFNATPVALPNSKVVEIVGNHKDVPNNSPQITFASGESLTCSASGKLVMKNLHVRWAQNAITLTTAPCELEDVYFEKLSAPDSGAALTGTDISDLRTTRVKISAAVASATANAMGVRVSGAARRVHMFDTDLVVAGSSCGMIHFSDVRNDVVIDKVQATDLGGTTAVTNCGTVMLGSTDNVTLAEIRNRVLSRAGSSIANIPLLHITTCGNLLMKDTQHNAAGHTVYFETFAAAGTMTIRGGRIAFITTNGTINADRLQIDDIICNENLSIGSFKDIIIRRSLFTDFRPITISPTRSGVIDDCEFRDNAQPANNNWWLALISGTNMELAQFTNNKITNYQNVAYTGGTDAHAMFWVRMASGGRCSKIVCAENVAKDVMNQSTGNTRTGSYLLDVATLTGTNDGIVGELIVSNNRLGSTITRDAVQLFRVFNCRIDAWDVDGNKVATVWNSNANQACFTHMCQIDQAAGQGGFNHANFSRNRFFWHNDSDTDYTKDVLRVDEVGGTATIYELTMNDNQFVSDSTNRVFDGVNAWGINVPSYTTVNLIFQHNTAALLTTSAPNWFFFRFTGAVTRSHPTMPSVGVQFLDNWLVARA